MNVHLSRTGSILRIVMDRPPVNALNDAMYRELDAAFSVAAAGEVVLLTSNARHFCAGQDLEEHRTQKTRTQQASQLQAGAAAILAALRCRAPIVAAVHGSAIGAGALLACAADVLIMAEDACLSLPELQVGLSIGGAVAARTLGGPLSRRMLLTGERADAAHLAAIGAAKVVSGEDLVPTALDAAMRIAALDPQILAHARREWGGGERESAALAYQAEVEGFLALHA